MKQYAWVLFLGIGFVVGSVWTRAQQDPRQVVTQADRDFDTATAAKGVAGWVSYFADDGKMYRSNGEITAGPAAIRALMEPFFSEPKNSLRWQPVSAEVAASGDLAYTTGVSQSKSVGQDGKLVQRDGRYVTIWRRTGTGPWRIALDIGASGPPKPVE